MDEFAAETKVEWREWGQDAFDVADRSGKPVLLALTAPWCEDCHEMDRTTYSEPRIAANVNDGFVPVRVDVDRRPRVRDRYNMGGFPSTVFLTPAGTVITGATYLGVDGFREILDAVRRTWDGKGLEAGSVPRSLVDPEPPGGDLSTAVEEHMVEQLLAAYDDEFGGWGTDVKFPLPRTVEFALVRARDQATRTLEAVRTRLTDTHDGGFHRYARDRDWGSPACEKLADENAAIVRAFARGYRYTGETAYRDTAMRGVEYLTTDLWTGAAFAASQGGDDAYYRLEATERADADPPGVDDTVFAGHNAVAIDALLSFAAYTDDERARSYAERALDALDDLVRDDGAVVHYRDAGIDPDADAGAPHVDEGDPADDGESGPAETGEAGLLVSQARTLVGLTTAWEVLGDPGRARDVADYAIDALQDDAGAFRDGPAPATAVGEASNDGSGASDGADANNEGGVATAGLLDRPLYPLDSNAELAHGLVDLRLLTGDDRYEAAAREALSAFAGATDRFGVEVAHYAAAVARLRAPRVVAVGSPAGSDLHRAALRLADHETTVAPGDDDRTRRADPGEAVVLADGEVTGRADSPEALESVLTDGES